MLILLSLLGAALANARHRLVRSMRMPRPVFRPFPYFQALDTDDTHRTQI